MRELAERLAILGVQSLDKRWVVEFRLTISFTHVSERMQALQNCLPARRRQLLPARKQGLPDVALLFGSHLLPDLLAFAQVLLLTRSQTVPGFEALANLRLLLRRQILEALVILQEFLLPLRRHVLETLDGLRRKLI